MLTQKVLPYKSAFNSNPNMSIAINAMQHTQHHIKKLMNTAAAGTGIVGDVDALLTPISKPSHTKLRVEQRTERNLWRTEEIMQMLDYMQKTNAISLLNDKTIKSENIFRTVEELMHKSGYRKKSHTQIWTKWKFLKSTYTTSKRNGTLPAIPPPVYQELHKMLGSGSSDFDSTANSLDGDNSNSSRLIISGVEGGYTNGGSTNRKSTATDEDDENVLAHPIFGFRLGLVKQEPADNGYEVTTNNRVVKETDTIDEQHANSSCSSLGCTSFQTEIKQEVEEVLEAPLPPLTVKKISKHSKIETSPKKRNNRVNLVHIAPKPPRNSISPVSNVQNTVNEPGLSASGCTTQMPPLRIAPFAKVSSANAMQQPAVGRPLPPLSMHPPVRTIHLGTTSNSSIATNLLQRKALTKLTSTPTPSQPMLTPIRLPKDITVQTRAATGAVLSPATRPNMRLKSSAVRKTYPVKSEPLIPHSDLTRPPSIFPQSQQQQQQYSIYEEGPSTSQAATNAEILGNKRKSRLDVPWNQTVPNKIPRLSPKKPRNEYNNNNEDSADNDGCNENSTQQKSKSKFFKPSQREHEYFDSALKDLTMSLRQSQREMLMNFFKNQMELARSEHEFQMQQDQLIMNAFAEQSRKLLSSAKEFLSLNSAEQADPNPISKCNKIQKPELKNDAAKRKIHAGNEGDKHDDNDINGNNAPQYEDGEDDSQAASDNQEQDNEQLDYDVDMYSQDDENQHMQRHFKTNEHEIASGRNEINGAILEMQEEQENENENDNDNEGEDEDEDEDEDEEEEDDEEVNDDENDAENDAEEEDEGALSHGDNESTDEIDDESEAEIADPIQLVTSELVED